MLDPDPHKTDADPKHWFQYHDLPDNPYYKRPFQLEFAMTDGKHPDKKKRNRSATLPNANY
jgi:hypothetical protein